MIDINKFDLCAFFYYCPVCDTPLDVSEYPPDEDYRRCYPDEPDGNDVILECPCCGWHASAIEQRTVCEAWEHVTGELKKATVLIGEPKDE